MATQLNENIKIDPSKEVQSFADVRIKLHCCRYWKLREWEFNDMAFPFWRLYYNSIEGANINYENKCTYLTSDKIIIIPPNTSFSTSLTTKKSNIRSESIIGERISNINEMSVLKEKRMVDHFFIHFNLGILHDNLKPGIYTFPVEQVQISLINSIKKEIIKDFRQINFAATLQINTLIFSVIESTLPEFWQIRRVDPRVTLILNYIESHTGEKLTNPELASKANMASNSFLRLFKENTGSPLQEYIQRRRIEKASVSLHHSSESIDDIALKYGFCDRYHFSKTFKKVMKISPAKYKQKLAMI